MAIPADRPAADPRLLAGARARLVLMRWHRAEAEATRSYVSSSCAIPTR
jgi:hypothetical protein